MRKLSKYIVVSALVLPTIFACAVAQEGSRSDGDRPETAEDGTENLGQVAEGLTAGCSVTSSSFTPRTCVAGYCWRYGTFRMTLACTQADCATVINQSAPRFGLTRGNLVGFIRSPSDYACVGQYFN